MKATNREEAILYGNNDLPPELEAQYLRFRNAKSDVVAIPQWSNWTEAQVLSWVQTNIGTPLASGRANLPQTLTLASIRVAILSLLDILDMMLVMLIAIARLCVALRNRNFPELPGE